MKTYLWVQYPSRSGFLQNKYKKNVKKRFFKVVFESYRKFTYGSGIQVGAESYKIEERKNVKKRFFKEFSKLFTKTYLWVQYPSRSGFLQNK